MTEAQLRGVMKFHLKTFRTDASITISNDTVHGKVLSDKDGFGQANSKRIYRSFIRWTLVVSGEKDRAWPANWMELTVKELAAKLLTAKVKKKK